jgi:hypothetical protein
LVFFCITEKRASEDSLMQIARLSAAGPSRRTGRRITLNNQARSSSADRRFSDRRKRIARRTERDTFKRLVMPALYVIAILGLFAFCAAAVYAAIAETDIQPFLPIAVGPVFLIGVMETYRLIRGHHSDSLEEP